MMESSTRARSHQHNELNSNSNFFCIRNIKCVEMSIMNNEYNNETNNNLSLSVLVLPVRYIRRQTTLPLNANFIYRCLYLMRRSPTAGPQARLPK